MIVAAVLSGAAAAATLKDCESAIDSGDGATAVQCLQPLALAGDPKAERLLADQYGTVNEPTHDPEKSALWMKKAAEHGDLEAQVMVGYMYRQGEGTPKDLARSVKWFRSAAIRGDQDAQFQLGVMLFKGWGTPRDVDQALSWLRKAADQDGPAAAVADLSIAGLYLKGNGVPKDDVEATRWFRRAAARGSPAAYLSLAQLDESGVGVPRDPVEAYVGYSIALAWLKDWHTAAQSTSAIAGRRDVAAAKLTPDQKTKADLRVHAWKGSVH
jgi:TPR repeat protein